ncbi:hypothetical protein [Methanoregula formicica]|nr:hypothetical protein [Methanoregula formicica]
MMRKTLVLILAGTLCVMLAASGCTGSAPATTPSPAATAAPVESPAIATTTAPPSPETLPWAGTWNSTWLEKDGNSTVSILHLAQAGTDVTGNYRYTYPGVGNFTGSLNATVQGNTLVGTYAESDDDTGFFVFELSENKRSFTGRWVHAVNKSELAGSALTWNGVRE